jgi:hypothetical protein
VAAGTVAVTGLNYMPVPVDSTGHHGPGKTLYRRGTQRYGPGRRRGVAGPPWQSTPPCWHRWGHRSLFSAAASLEYLLSDKPGTDRNASFRRPDLARVAAKVLSFPIVAVKMSSSGSASAYSAVRSSVWWNLEIGYTFSPAFGLVPNKAGRKLGMESTLTLGKLFSTEADLVGDVPTAGIGFIRSRLPNQVTIGRTEVVKLTSTSAGVTTELAGTLDNESKNKSYYALNLTCSFRPSAHEIIEGDMVVVLRRAKRKNKPPLPVAWSLDPLMRSTPVQYTRTRSLNVDVKFIPQAPSIGTTVSKSETSTQQNYYIVAVGEGESAAGWHFKKTKDVELVGIHHLSMIVQAPPRARCVGEIALRAKVKRPPIPIWYYAVIAPSVGDITFKP